VDWACSKSLLDSTPTASVTSVTFSLDSGASSESKGRRRMPPTRDCHSKLPLELIVGESTISLGTYGPTPLQYPGARW